MFSKYLNQPETVPNNAGGQSYTVTDATRFDRFLILGIEGGTYYVAERDMAKSSMAFVEKYIDENFAYAVPRLAEISDSGRALKNEPAIFSLAVALKAVGASEFRRVEVAKTFPKVIRTMAHLQLVIEYMQQLKVGWGRWKRGLFTTWFNKLGANQAAYQVAKYQTRNGWSVRDILRLAHVKPANLEMGAVYEWVVKGTLNTNAPKYLQGVEFAKCAKYAEEISSIVKEYGLVRESVPTEWLKEKAVWEVLLDKMPLTAMIRNLGTMSKNGLLTPFSESEKKVVNLLINEEVIRKSRVHPFTLFLALKQYGEGHGFRGDSSWPVNQTILMALEKAINLAYGNVEATGKTFMLACDISGSMGGATIANTNVTALEAEALIVSIVNRIEPLTHTYTFTTSFSKFEVKGESYRELHSRFARLLMGGTDCGLPVEYALANNLKIDCFLVITDNETWANRRPIAESLKEYRKKVNPKARFIVLGMTATEFTVAPPNDPLSLDIVGMDANVPQLIAEFVRD